MKMIGCIYYSGIQGNDSRNASGISAARAANMTAAVLLGIPQRRKANDFRYTMAVKMAITSGSYTRLPRLWAPMPR